MSLLQIGLAFVAGGGVVAFLSGIRLYKASQIKDVRIQRAFMWGGVGLIALGMLMVILAIIINEIKAIM